MTELFYDTKNLARFLVRNELGARESLVFLRRVFREDREYLHPKLREQEKAFISGVLYWMDYLSDKETIDKEYPAIERDFTSLGHRLDRDHFHAEFPDLDMFFMSMRLELRFIRPRGYMRMKLRTLLKEYDHKRRSRKLISHIRECIYFYHIQPFLRGQEECDITEIALDDMIVFRVM